MLRTSREPSWTTVFIPPHNRVAKKIIQRLFFSPVHKAENAKPLKNAEYVIALTNLLPFCYHQKGVKSSVQIFAETNLQYYQLK